MINFQIGFMQAVAVPTKEAHQVGKYTVQGMLNIHYVHFTVFLCVGLPSILTKDNGSEFSDKLNNTIMKQLRI